MLTVVSVLSLGLSAIGQTPTGSPTAPAIVGVIGEVKNLDAASNQIIVRADSGVLYTVNLSERTKYKRSAPGAKSLENATAITLAEVGSGDRVWAYGRVSEQQKTVPAQMLVVMSKADLAKKQEQERAEWRRRGVSASLLRSTLDTGNNGFEPLADGSCPGGNHSRDRQGNDAALSSGYDSQVQRSQAQQVCRKSKLAISCAPLVTRPRTVLT